MGSVMDYEVCKHCGGVKFVDFYYKTGEEYTFCQRCGTVDNWVMKRNEDGEVVIGEDKRPIGEHIFHAGYGTYAIFQREGVGQTGSFSEPISEKVISEFKEIFSQPEIDLEKSFLARWENGEHTLLLGSEVPDINRLSFEEWDKKMTSESSNDQDEVEVDSEDVFGGEIELTVDELPDFDEILKNEK